MLPHKVLMMELVFDHSGLKPIEEFIISFNNGLRLFVFPAWLRRRICWWPGDFRGCSTSRVVESLLWMEKSRRKQNAASGQLNDQWVRPLILSICFSNRFTHRTASTQTETHLRRSVPVPWRICFNFELCSLSLSQSIYIRSRLDSTQRTSEYPSWERCRESNRLFAFDFWIFNFD